MKIFVCKDKNGLKTIRNVEELHISRWKKLIITYLNFETKPFSKCFEPHEWDSVIINKKKD